MKPKPFSALNHLTVPVAKTDSFLTGASEGPAVTHCTLTPATNHDIGTHGAAKRKPGPERRAEAGLARYAGGPSQWRAEPRGQRRRGAHRCPGWAGAAGSPRP